MTTIIKGYLQIISILLGFKMLWLDSRIIVDIDQRKEYAQLSRDQKDNFWFPDLYILNSKDVNVPKLTLDPIYLRLFKNGIISYSISKEVNTVCPMNFINYPVSCLPPLLTKIVVVNFFSKNFKNAGGCSTL